MTELIRLRDRVEELERVLGVDRNLTSRLRDAFGIEPGMAPVLGMLLKRNFVSHDSLYTVLFAGRPECDWPEPKLMDVQICKLRRVLKRHGISIKTRWGEGWLMSSEDKAKVRAVLDAGNVMADLSEKFGDKVATAYERHLGARRQAFLEGV